jgi:hypothetical protein
LQLRAVRKGCCLICSCFPSVEFAQAKPPFLFPIATRDSGLWRFFTLHLAVATLSEICLLSISNRCFFDIFLIARECTQRRGAAKTISPLAGRNSLPLKARHQSQDKAPPV